MLVDVERSPYPSAVSQLSGASSNTLNPPLIRPYPLLHHTLLKVHAPNPQMGRHILLVSSLEKKYIGRPEREILAPIADRNYLFKSYMYKAIPTPANRAERTGGPLSPLPCQARHGCEISIAHHGEVRG
jgi:hypothetical protein